MPHICTLKEDQKRHWGRPNLPRNASRFAIFKRKFLDSLLPTNKNPNTKLYFNSTRALINETERLLNSPHPYIIHPCSFFRMVWEIIMMVIFMLCMVVFPMDAYWDAIKHHFFNLTDVIIFMLKLICLVDMAITCISGYCDEDNLDIILDQRQIIRRYMCSFMFYGDLISSIPFVMIPLAMGVENHYASILLPICNAFKFMRLPTLILYLGHCLELLKLKPIHTNGVKAIIAGTLILHWIACLHVAIPLYIRLATTNNMSHSWVFTTELLSETITEFYVSIYFRAFSFMLIIGHDLYLAETDIEIIMTIVTILISDIFAKSVLTKFYSYMNDYVSVYFLELFHEGSAGRVKYESEIKKISNYMDHKRLPNEFQQRMFEYYGYKFKKNYFRIATVDMTVGDVLYEVDMFSHQKLINSVPILRNLSANTIKNLSRHLKEEIFLPKDVIIKAGTYGNCLYFLQTGTACVLTSTGMEVCHLNEGAYFGEIALLSSNHKRTADVVALETCLTYRLDRKVFKACFMSEDSLLQTMIQKADERLEETKQAEIIHNRRLMEKIMCYEKQILYE